MGRELALLDLVRCVQRKEHGREPVGLYPGPLELVLVGGNVLERQFAK